MNMKSIKTTALRSEPTEPTSEDTSWRIFGNALMLRSGLRTLKVRKALTLNQLSSIISMMPVTTTTKSSQFHRSFR